MTKLTLTDTVLAIWQPIILVLLDITPMMGVLDGVLMELQDCALPLLKGELGRQRERILYYCISYKNSF
jgi:hypothetical protein